MVYKQRLRLLLSFHANEGNSMDTETFLKGYNNVRSRLCSAGRESASPVESAVLPVYRFIAMALRPAGRGARYTGLSRFLF